MGYVFIGEGNLQDHYGSKPMSINWGLIEPISLSGICKAFGRLIQKLMIT